jgi:hypothetical protein
MSERAPPLKLRALQPLLAVSQRTGENDMPHLHLPSEHSDADVVLAANVAESVGCTELYITWTHDAGAGAIPDVQAILHDRRPSFLAELMALVRAGARTLWHGLVEVPPAAPAIATGPQHRRPRAAGEPSA